MVEVVTLGETMLRLSPVTVSTLEETQQFQVDVGCRIKHRRRYCKNGGAGRMDIKTGRQFHWPFDR